MEMKKMANEQEFDEKEFQEKLEKVVKEINEEEQKPDYTVSDGFVTEDSVKIDVNIDTFNYFEDLKDSYVYFLLEAPDQCVELEMTKPEAIKLVSMIAKGVGLTIGIDQKKQLGELISELQKTYDQLE